MSNLFHNTWIKFTLQDMYVKYVVERSIIFFTLMVLLIFSCNQAVHTAVQLHNSQNQTIFSCDQKVKSFHEKENIND